MKCLIKAFFIMLSAIAVTHPVYANEVNVFDLEAHSGEAAVLVTQPAKINSDTGKATDQTSRLEEISNSIGAVHNQASPSINPLEFFKNPSASVKKFFSSPPNQTPQPVDPLGVSKTPALDAFSRGSISVPITHF